MEAFLCAVTKYVCDCEYVCVCVCVCVTLFEKEGEAHVFSLFGNDKTKKLIAAHFTKIFFPLLFVTAVLTLHS